MKRTKPYLVTPRFRWYLIIGSAAFLVEYTSFAILATLGATLLVSQSISFLFGFIVSFTGNRKITFNSKSIDYALSQTSQLWRYALLAAVNLLLSNAAIYLLVDYLYVDPLIAKGLVMIAVVGWNYVLFNKIIFRTNR